MALVDVRLTIRPGEAVRIDEAAVPQLAHQGLIQETVPVPSAPRRRRNAKTTRAGEPGEPEGTSS